MAQPVDPAAKLVHFGDPSYQSALQACFDLFSGDRSQQTMSVTTAGKVAAYVRAKGMDPHPWSTMPAGHVVDVCGYLASEDDPCTSDPPAHRKSAPLIRYATTASKTYSSYPQGQWHAPKFVVCATVGYGYGTRTAIVDP